MSREHERGPGQRADTNLGSGGSTEEAQVVDGFLSGRLTRRQAIGRLAVLGFGLAGASTLLAACRTNPGPNILVIIADDMRLDWLPFMPNVQQLLQAQGCTFTQARCNVALCQPARVGFHTGQMSKHNNELGVGFIGTEFIDRDNSLGNWMKTAGYRCGQFGKFINFWDSWGGVNPPAGWKTWYEFINASNSYDFRVRVGTETQRVTGTYDSDWLAAQIDPFMNGLFVPFFGVLAPSQPHYPSTSRADLVNAFNDFVWQFVEEADFSDKPSWMQASNPPTQEDRDRLVIEVRGMLRELAAVDDMVGRAIAALPAERLAETIIVFTSDNGVYCGDHRRHDTSSKSGPYDVALHVPLIVRGPGFAAGSEVSAPVMVFQDLAATALKIAGATAGLPDQAGVSLVDMAANPGAYAERLLLHEIAQGFYGVTGDGVTTGPNHPIGFRKLFRYPSVRSGIGGPYVYEAYDLDADPNELANWADDETRRPERDVLEAQLDALLA